MFLEEHHVLLLKCFGPMVLGLAGKVFLDRVTIEDTHRECIAAWLSGKAFHPDGFVNPA